MNDYLLLALIELGALAVLGSAAFATYFYLRRRKLETAVRAAAKKLRKSGEDRQRTLTAILSGVHLLPESVSAGLSSQLMQCERALLRQCYDILLSPDPASAARLSDALLAGLDDYLRKCAAPNMPRTETPALESAAAPMASTPEAVEKLPYWMDKLKKGEPPAEDEVPPEARIDPEAFWPAAGDGIEEAGDKDRESAPAEESGARLLAAPAGSFETPEETQRAYALEETASPAATADFAGEIGGLLDAYDKEDFPVKAAESARFEASRETAGESATDAAVEFPRASPVEPPAGTEGGGSAQGMGGDESSGHADALSLEDAEAAETGLDATILPPPPPAVTVEDLMAEFGLAPHPAEKPAPARIPLRDAAASAAPDGDVDALLAEFGFHTETPPAAANETPPVSPVEKPLAAASGTAQADAAAVDALLAEFGFHEEEEAEIQIQPGGVNAEEPPEADPAAVEALLAEFGLIPGASATPQPEVEAPESAAKAASKRRGRKKAESPESGT